MGYYVNEGDLTRIANAIRNKSDTTSGLIFPHGFVNVINTLVKPSEPETGATVCTIGGSEYKSVAEALSNAASGDTVLMIADSDESGKSLVIPEGVTLDLQVYTLTADVVVGMDGAMIAGTTDPNKNDGVLECGKLAMPKGNLKLAEEPYKNTKGQPVLPIWSDEHGCYLLSLFIANTDRASNAAFGLTINTVEKTIEMLWKPQATGIINQLLITPNGASDNDMEYKVVFEWLAEGATSKVEVKYNDDLIILATGTSGLLATISNYESLSVDLPSLKVTPMIVSKSGAVSVGTTWTYDMATVTTTPIVAKIGDAEYKTVAEALSKATNDDIVLMVADSDESGKTLVIPEGVTLDLAGKNLDAHGAIALSEGKVTDSSANQGLLKIPQGNLKLNENNGLFPVYNGTTGYLFGDVKYGRKYTYNAETDIIKYDFLCAPVLEVVALMKDGIVDNEFQVTLLATWDENGGTVYQEFVVDENTVIEVANSNTGTVTGYGKMYTVSITGLGNKTNLKIRARVVSNSGAVDDDKILDFATGTFS